MSIIQGNAKQGSTRGFYSFPLEQSLRFNDGDSPYFEFTFGTPTNQIKWTMSFWCKRGEIGREHSIYGASNGGGETFFVAFYPDDIEAYISSGRNHVTNAVFRDPSAWYHIVQVFDSANATADDRFITYVNGVRQTTSTNSVALNDTTGWNTSGVTGYLGENYGGWFGDSRDYFDGYLAEVNFIDGQALDPTSFGELKSGVWIPKDPTGLTYGTNGFRLSFADDAEVEAFNTVLYRGNGGTQSITGMGMDADLIWIKSRSGANSHFLTDTVRGATKTLFTNTTSAEVTESQGLTAFSSDGFTVGNDASVNASGSTYVAWGWKAGDSNVSNTDGSITSTVRANTTYGFSIVSYTGTGSAATIGHGLNATPDMVITKNRDATTDWQVYHADVITADNQQIELNNTGGVGTVGTACWDVSEFDADTIGLGANNTTNGSGNDMIAYCWAEKSGYSKFGSYTGNSGTQTVTTGFKPAFILIKRTDGTGSWSIFDNTRNTSNPADKVLFPDTSGAEYTQSGAVDFNDNGFDINVGFGYLNYTGYEYIYAAFADTREAAFWLDQSGNDNDWQPVNLDHNDTVADSPTDNFATLNPLDSLGTLTDGNLKYTTVATGFGMGRATQGFKTGKWYWEVTVNAASTAELIGVIDETAKLTSGSAVGYLLDGGVDSIAYYANGNKYINGTGTSYGSSYTVGDVIGVALNLDDNEITFYKNGVSQGVISYTFSGNYIFPALSDGTGSSTLSVFTANFGQQPFKYDPPA